MLWFCAEPVLLPERETQGHVADCVMRMSVDSAVRASIEIRPSMDATRKSKTGTALAGEPKLTSPPEENEPKGFSKLIGVYLPAVTLHPIGRWIVLLLECGLIAAAAYGCRRVKTDFNYV